MSTYKELAEHLEAYFKNAHRMDEVIAILRSLDAQPVAEPTPEMLAAFKEAWKGGSIWTDRATFALSEVFRNFKLYAAPVVVQASMPLSDSHPLAVFAQECAIGAHDYGGLRLAAQNALKAAHGIKERG